MHQAGFRRIGNIENGRIRNESVRLRLIFPMDPWKVK